MYKEDVLYIVSVVVALIVIVAVGFTSGEVLVWGCDVVGYDVNDVVVRSVWVCVYFGVVGVNWGRKE